MNPKVVDVLDTSCKLYPYSKQIGKVMSHVVYQTTQIARARTALTARKETMRHARVLKNLGICGYVALVKKAKEQSAYVRYLKAEYPDLLALI